MKFDKMSFLVPEKKLDYAWEAQAIEDPEMRSSDLTAVDELLKRWTNIEMEWMVLHIIGIQSRIMPRFESFVAIIDTIFHVGHD